MKHRILSPLIGLLALVLVAPMALVAQGPQGCPADMSHYWKMDETTGPPYVDYFDANDATCTVCPAPIPGIIIGAQQFGGIPGAQRVNVADDGTFDWGASSSFSIELWVRKTAVTSQAEVFLGRVAMPKVWWLGIYTDNKLYFQLKDTGGGVDLRGTQTIQPNIWYHIVAIHDGVANTVNLYVNGLLDASLSHTYIDGFASAADINIGWFNTGTFFYLNGDLDEIALYDRVLTPTEIQGHFNGGAGEGYCQISSAPQIISTPPLQATVGQLYTYDVNATGDPAPTYALLTSPSGMTINQTSGVISWVPTSVTSAGVTVAANNTAGQDLQSFTVSASAASFCPAQMSHLWRLDEVGGQPYHDELGTDATCTNCPASTPGRVSLAQQFALDDSVNVPDDNSYDWGPAASFTIEFWMNQADLCTGTATNNNQVIVARFDTNARSWWLGINCDIGSPTQGVIRFRLGDTGGPADVYSTTAVTDGLWHHVAAVRDGTAGMTLIYVDGVLENSVAHAYSDGFASAAPLTIGHFNITPYYHYTGVLDELALYDRSLSGAEILGHYQRGLSGSGYCALCGDANGDGGVDISDAVFLIGYIFSGGAAPNPYAAGDANCDASVDISDAVYLISFIFSGGPAPCANCR